MKQIVTILAISVVLTNCQKKAEINSPSESIEGSTWSTSCTSAGQGYYDTRSANFTNGQFTMSQSGFSDASCASGYLKMDVTGTYVFSGVIDDKKNYVGVDETLASITVTPLSATIVSYYNTNSYCGFTNWTLNVAKNITGLNCGGDQISAAGTVGYDIYYASNGILNFGLYDSTHNGTSTVTRPEELDTAFSFTK